MRFRLLLVLLLAALTVAASDPAASPKPHPLAWDAMEKTLDARPGDETADFEFRVTNKSPAAVEILELRPSCGCTVADMPATPWKLEPGASGSFRTTVDFRGKHGRFSKAIHVHSTAGTQMLGVVVNIPEPDEAARLRNQQLALADRQAVFRGDCASCHAAPAGGKLGAELFQAACGICHLAPHRASMVPDLLAPRELRDAAYWEKWIADGKEQTLMPGFAQKHGGPLTDGQIRSLVEFAVEHLPATPRPNRNAEADSSETPFQPGRK